MVTVHPFGSLISLPVVHDATLCYKWYSFRSSYSSYGQDQPADNIVTLSCVPDSSQGSVIGTTYPFYARPGFIWGSTAPNNANASTITPVIGTTVTSTVTPLLIILKKTALLHESETATGRNFPFTYQIVATIASGQTVTGVTISDVFPNSLVLLSSTVTSTPSAVSSVLNPSTGILVWNYGA